MFLMDRWWSPTISPKICFIHLKSKHVYSSGWPSASRYKCFILIFSLSQWTLKYNFELYFPYLVGGFSPTQLKNMLVKLDHLPRVSGENKKNRWVATTHLFSLLNYVILKMFIKFSSLAIGQGKFFTLECAQLAALPPPPFCFGFYRTHLWFRWWSPTCRVARHDTMEARQAPEQVSGMSRRDEDVKIWMFTTLWTLRIQIYPKKGISPVILFWGWDWDHQSYSRDGSGFLRKHINFNSPRKFQFDFSWNKQTEV